MFAQKASASRGYVGLTGGVSAWNVDCSGYSDCNKTPGSLRVFGGYNIIPSVAVEVSYRSLGKPSAKISNGSAIGTVNYEGNSFDVAGVYKFNSGSAFVPFVKGGVAIVQAKATGNVTSSGQTVYSKSDSKTATGLILGVGATYSFIPNFAVRAELDTQKVDVGGSSGNVTTFGIGGQYQF